MKDICIAAIGTRGDICPALALANILSGKNRIRIVTSPDHLRLFEQYRDDCFTVGEDFSKVAGSGDIALYRKQIELQFASHRAVYENANVIIGAGLFYAGRTLAEYFGKQYYHLFFTPQVLKSDLYAPAGTKRPFRGKLRNRLLWMKSLGENDFILKALINGKRKELGLAPVASVYRYFIDRPDTIIAVDERIAQIPHSYTSYIRQIHTLYHEDAGNLDDALQDFLGSGSKPVVVNFGSAEYTVREYQALLKRTVDTVYGCGYRVVVISKATVGEYLRNDNVFFCGYAPHASLLPKAEAIIHHGGIGTAYASLKSAAPQIIIPQGMDQHYWAEIIREKKWGKAAYSDCRFFPAQLKDALHSIVNDRAILDSIAGISGRLNSGEYHEESMQKLRTAMPACFMEETV
jgi:vancomycin aglycone glucosyltransferase